MRRQGDAVVPWEEVVEREGNSFFHKLHGFQSRHPQVEESLTINRIRVRVGQNFGGGVEGRYQADVFRCPGPDAGAAP
jgi:hypothetical protein